MSIVDLAYQHALDRLAQAGFAALTQPERDAAVLWHLEAGMNSGGLAGYYAGAGGDLATHAPEALARVGATEKSAIVRAANALFGPAGPPCERPQRRAALKALDAPTRGAMDELEARYYHDPADVDELFEQTLNKPPSGGGSQSPAV